MLAWIPGNEASYGNHAGDTEQGALEPGCISRTQPPVRRARRPDWNHQERRASQGDRPDGCRRRREARRETRVHQRPRPRRRITGDRRDLNAYRSSVTAVRKGELLVKWMSMRRHPSNWFDSRTV